MQSHSPSRVTLFFKTLFLNYFCIGSGYLALGRNRRFAVCAALFFLIYYLFIFGSPFDAYFQIPYYLIGAFVVLILIDAVFVSRRPPVKIMGRRALRPVALVLFVIGLGLFVSAQYLLARDLVTTRTFFMTSPNMVPGLLEGDLLVARAWAWRDRQGGANGFQRGDVVMHRQGDSYFLRRIVALPGERFSVSSGVAVIDGNSFNSEIQVVMKVIYSPTLPRTDGIVLKETTPEGRSYQIVVRQLPDAKDKGASAVLTVPEGYVAVLSDNRMPYIPEDYVKIGFVPFEGLIARPLRVIASVDATRVGQAVR